MNAFGQPRPLRALRLWELREGPGVRVLPHAARQAQAPVGQRLATGFDTRQPLPPPPPHSWGLSEFVWHVLWGRLKMGDRVRTCVRMGDVFFCDTLWQ